MTSSAAPLRFNPNSARSVHPPPYGIRPEGNLYFSDVSKSMDQKRRSLGPLFSTCSDEDLVNIFSYLNGTDLLALNCTGRYMRAFANHVDLWRDLFWNDVVVDEAAATADEGPYGKGIEKRVSDDPIRFMDTWKSTWIERFRTGTNSDKRDPAIEVASRPEKKIKFASINDLPLVYSDLLYNPYRVSGLEPTPGWDAQETVERVSAKSLTRAGFVERFEVPNKPAIITDAIQHWEAYTTWSSVAELGKIFASIDDPVLACGPVSMRMSEYVGYLSSGVWRTDESPYFVFDAKFFQHSDFFRSSYNRAADLQKILSLDLFDLLDPPFRPEHAWLLVGPPGACSKWHVDPNSTSAWNAVIRGKKKWVLVPPHAGPPTGVETSSDGFAVKQPLTLADWLETCYADAKNNLSNTTFLECTCSSGEVMFVPRGWWHCVMNVGDEPTIAITQNYAAEVGVNQVRMFLKKFAHCVSGVPTTVRAGLWKEFDRVLGEHRPDLILSDEDTLVEEPFVACDEGRSFWASFETAGRTLNFSRI